MHADLTNNKLSIEQDENLTKLLNGQYKADVV